MRFSKSVVGKSVAVVAAATCAVAVTTGSASAAPAGRAPVAMHTTAAHTVVAPARLRPGVVRIKNTGADNIYVVRAKRFGIPRLIQDAGKRGPGPLLRDFVVVNAMAGHGTAVFRLVKGTYYLFDGDAATIAANRVHTLRVAGRAVNAAMPKASAAVSVTRAKLLRTHGPASAGGWFALSDNSTNWYGLFAAHVGGTVKAAALRSFLKHPTFARLSAIETGDQELGVVGPHQVLRVSRTLAAGRWIVIALPATAGNAKLTPSTVALINIR